MPSRPTLTLEWLPAQGPGTADGSWADISSYLVSGTTFTGRSYELERFGAGTATFTVRDTTRRFDPEWTSGAWYGQLVPMRQIRLKATWNAVTYDVWRGYVVEWGQAVPSSDRVWISTIVCKDATALFERMGLPGSWCDLAVSADSPSHWWRLDETSGFVAADSGGASTKISGPYTPDVTLNDLQLIPYDGGRKGVTFPAGNYVDARGAAPTSTSWSVECWFYVPTPVTFAGTSPILMTINRGFLGLSTDRPAFSLTVSNNVTGAINAAIFTSLSNANVTGSAGGVDDQLVHHVVATYVNSTRTLTLYLDGTLVGSASAASGTVAFTSAHPVEIGGTSELYSLPAEVTVQGVVFYDGVVLSSTQVANHYNAGANAHAGDDTGTHIGRVLDYKGFPSALRDLDTGTSTVGAYELTASTVAEFMNQMADTESGQTYIGPDGKLVHRSRGALFTEARSTTSQATFADAHGAATLKYVADGFSMVRDPELIRNPVTAQISAGRAYTAKDTTYTAKYGDRAWSAPVTYDSTDAVSIDRANVFLGRYRELNTRLENMRIMPGRSATLLYPQVLGRLIGDRITVNRKPLNTGNETSLAQLIEAIRHQFSADVWITEYRGSPPDTANYALYDDGTKYDDGTVYGF